MTFNGAKIPDDPTAGPQLTAFDGKEYVQRKGQTIIEEGSYEVDPSKTPRSIDFVIKKGPDAGKRQLGIYELDGQHPAGLPGRARVDETAQVVRRRADTWWSSTGGSGPDRRPAVRPPSPHHFRDVSREGLPAMRVVRAVVILSVFGLLGAAQAKKDDGGASRGTGRSSP